MADAAQFQGPTVLVAILHQGWVRPEWVFSPVIWGRDPTIRYLFATLDSKPTCDNRNRICAGFLEHPDEPDILMMCDHDISVPRSPGAVVHAMLTLADRAVVGLLCPTWRPDLVREQPIRWAAFNADEGGTLVQDFDLNVKEPLEVAMVGSGAILIRREVLEHPAMRAPFMDVWTEEGTRMRGHDYNFCLRARAAGFGVWLDRSYVCGHLRLTELLDVAAAGVAPGARMADGVPEWAAS